VFKIEGAETLQRRQTGPRRCAQPGLDRLEELEMDRDRRVAPPRERVLDDDGAELALQREGAAMTDARGQALIAVVLGDDAGAAAGVLEREAAAAGAIEQREGAAVEERRLLGAV